MKKRYELPVAAALLLAMAAVPAASATTKRFPSKTTRITVMTRNVFLGTDLIPLATTPAGPTFEAAASKLLAEVRSGDPAGRMKVIADEIATATPDVVGLQEVSTWRTGPRGQQPTTTVADFLPLIGDELLKRHVHYNVVGKHLALHIVAPIEGNQDVTFDNGDVMLVRAGLKVSHVRATSYRKQFIVPTQAVGMVSPSRGYNAFDATIDGAKLHFVNTHLEAYDPATRLAQAQEAVAGPLKSTRTTILLGDLNSGAILPKPEDRPPYNAIAAAGFVPHRTKVNSCCFDELNDASKWDHNVDWIMSKGKGVKLVRSALTGSEQTPSGLHPSDHGAVISVLSVPRS